MADFDIYASIAVNLGEFGWSSVLSQVDDETRAKIFAALDSVKDVTNTTDESIPQDDPQAAIAYLSERFNKVVKGLRAHRKRLEAFDVRLDAIEANGGASNEFEPRIKPLEQRMVSQRDKKRKSGQVKSQLAPVDNSRKHAYRFGSRNLGVVKPLEYPNHSDARRERVHGELILEYVHGYNGQSEDARQNICVTPDGNFLVYFIAAVGIVYNMVERTQQFFVGHNDDLTTICLDPREGSTLVATGQKDPKDTPGQGKDLPKIWIWDYTNCRKVKLLENICWGKVRRIQWSKNGNLYVIGGDPSQTLKIFDSSLFNQKGPVTELFKGSTTKEQIFGFEINPNPNTDKFVDDFVIFGKHKLYYAVVVNQNERLDLKIRSVSITSFKRDGEKAFLCAQYLPDGRYVVGASSGALYVCQGSNLLSVIANGHDRAVGDLAFHGNLLISTGMDRVIKKWEFVPDSDIGSSNSGIKKLIDRKSIKKQSPLVESWNSGIIEIPGSDFILCPRCMVYDEINDCVYIGSKTNQMIKYEMKTEDTSLIVDGHDGPIWGLATSPNEALFITGGYDNAIKLWDANNHKCIDTLEFELNEEDKIGWQMSCSAWSNNGDIIAVGSEQSKIAILSVKPLKVLAIHSILPKTENSELEAVSYLRFSEDGTLLAAAHMDSRLYIFSILPAPNGVLLEEWKPMEHVSAPTHVQFSVDGTMIKTFTRDYEICHWKLNHDHQRGKYYPKIPLPEDVLWGGDPLIAGWDVQGLYQNGWDGTDLNDATLTSDQLLIASGDDYGIVRLHNYPAIVPESHKKYHGHAEFVVGVEFLRDDSQLITCGGSDMSIMQWRLIKD